MDKTHLFWWAFGAWVVVVFVGDDAMNYAAGATSPFVYAMFRSFYIGYFTTEEGE